MEFPENLALTFDFRAAIADETIQQILLLPDCNYDFLQAELPKLHIVPKLDKHSP
jgi:hypothetical protein